MIRELDSARMVTDLDANHLKIRNLGSYLGQPPPGGTVGEDDPRLSDPRTILDGTVTDDSVADDAGIVQSKINFNDNIPPQFLGTDQAARGDLVEQTAYKNQINGYAGLGLDGKLGTGSTPTAGTGTLHTIDINFPTGELTGVPDISTPDFSIDGFWDAQSADTFFGNTSGDVGRPIFDVGRAFPVALIPGFDASRITSETFSTDRLPVAVGVGAGHSAGLAPDPGPLINTSSNPDDYLGRDMHYHRMQIMAPSQPTLPNPSITVQSYSQGKAYVNITTNVSGTNLFYATDGGSFTEVTRSVTPGSNPTLPLLLDIGTIVSAYVAKIGYNNSNITKYEVPMASAPTPGGH